jgi:hypothetical protein
MAAGHLWQGSIKQAAFDFQVNPASRGFQLHKIGRAKDQRFLSFRVNKDLRVIVHKGESSLVLCYADHHDATYAWAEVRKLAVHPQTGAAQMVEVKERVEEVVRQEEAMSRPDGLDGLRMGGWRTVCGHSGRTRPRSSRGRQLRRARRRPRLRAARGGPRRLRRSRRSGRARGGGSSRAAARSTSSMASASSARCH